jgi:hypothetical protein
MNRPALERLLEGMQHELDALRPWSGETVTFDAMDKRTLYYAARWWALAEARSVLDALLAEAPAMSEEVHESYRCRICARVPMAGEIMWSGLAGNRCARCCAPAPLEAWVT